MRQALIKLAAIVCVGAAFGLAATPAALGAPGHEPNEPHLETEPRDDGESGSGLVITAVLLGFVVVGASLVVLKRSQSRDD